MLKDSAWPLVSLLPFVLYFVRCAVVHARRTRRGDALPPAAQLDVRGFGKLGGWLRQVGAFALQPLCDAVARSGVGPNALTFGCLLVCTSAGTLIALGAVAWGGVLGLIGCSLDYFDGRIARLSGRESRSGAFLDGTLDRCGELALLGGAALLLRDAAWALAACLIALGASGVISYARAKAEALGMDLRCGFMQRPERALLFCLGACLSTALDGWLPAAARGCHLVFAIAIAALALLTTQTAWVRVVRGFHALRSGEAAYTGPTVSIPPINETAPRPERAAQ